MARESRRWSWSWSWSWALAWATVALCVAVAEAADYSDLRGPYCATRRHSGCCRSRVDECSVPILGTLCYCDEFCNRTRSEDCCPDYWSHCLGIEFTDPSPSPIQTCYHNGRYLLVGQSSKINCNHCTCTAMGNRAEIMCDTQRCLVEADIMTAVNSAFNYGSLPWRASNYSAFWGRRLDEGLRLRLGTLQPHNTVRRMRPVVRRHDASRLPRSFDARTRWPGWVQGVRDQGWCGSSWALSTAAVGSDRFAIISMGEEPAQLSAQQLLACNSRGQQGCSGGHLDRAWIFLRKFGVVDDPCYPYASWDGRVEACRVPRKSSLQSAGCTAIRHPEARSGLYRMGPVYRLGSEEDIMFEIMESGPVQATMRVYHDFFMYRGGVYVKSEAGNSDRTGYHSVRIVGWGEDVRRGRPIKYWLVANSWGELWGENGYFRIERGSNQCEIEDFVLASWADTVSPPVEKMKHNGNHHGNHHPNYV